MLRIAYEVIKRYKPDAIITLGGIGHLSFCNLFFVAPIIQRLIRTAGKEREILHTLNRRRIF
jgi:hypothetical protein